MICVAQTTSSMIDRRSASGSPSPLNSVTPLSSRSVTPVGRSSHNHCATASVSGVQKHPRVALQREW